MLLLPQAATESSSAGICSQADIAPYNSIANQLSSHCQLPCSMCPFTYEGSPVEALHLCFSFVSRHADPKADS